MPCPLKDRARRSCWRTRYKRPRRVVTPTPPPGAMKCSHDVQTTTSAAPTKKRSSKSRENVRGAKGTIRLTQVGIEEVKNVAQCSLVTSTGKVVTFKFSLDYDKPSELCRHLVRKGNGLLLHCIFRYQFTFCNSNFLFTFVCVCVSHSTSPSPPILFVSTD